MSAIFLMNGALFAQLAIRQPLQPLQSLKPFKSLQPSQPLSIKAFKKEKNNDLPVIDFFSNSGHFLDIGMQPTGVQGPRVFEQKKYLNTSIVVSLGESGWYVRAGLTMDGWYEPGVGAKVTDAFLKRDPMNVLSITGYSPALGLEKRFGKRKRSKISLLYGLVPPNVGVNIFSTQKNRQQVRLSGVIAF